jgi:hypothetical protein
MRLKPVTGDSEGVKGQPLKTVNPSKNLILVARYPGYSGGRDRPQTLTTKCRGLWLGAQLGNSQPEGLG